jgi:protein-S-isoprenylcysteine O-methyltransferase Ste14
MTNKSKGILLVVVQFVLLAVIVALPHGTAWPVYPALGMAALILMMLGLMVTLLGIVSLGNSLTATPVPKENAELRTQGMYLIVRHPIYLGLILIALGLTLPASSVLTALAFIAFVIFLSYKARFEEHLLLSKFPDYKKYASSVGRLIPFVGKLR